MVARRIIGTEETLLLGIGNTFKENGTIGKEGYSQIRGKDMQGRL